MLLDQIIKVRLILKRTIGNTLRGLSQLAHLWAKINLINFLNRRQNFRGYLMLLGLILKINIVSRLLNHRILAGLNDYLFLCVEIWVDVGISALICAIDVGIDLDQAFYWSWWIRSIINIIKRRKIILFTASTLEIKHAVLMWIRGQHLSTIQPMEASSRNRYLPIAIRLLINLHQILVTSSLNRGLNYASIIFELIIFNLLEQR